MQTVVSVDPVVCLRWLTLLHQPSHQSSRLDALAVGDDDGEGAPPRQRDWGLGGLLSPAAAAAEAAEAEAGAATPATAEYQPRLTLGRHQPLGHAQQHDAMIEIIDLQSEPEEEENEEEEEEEGDGDSASSLWGRVGTEVRVRWLLWKTRARYRLQGKGSAGGGGKRYI